jgi:hypothetical protein
MAARRSPLEILPREVGIAVASERYWFVIGGQAVRCILPYRPSRDVDFGVLTAKDSKQLLAQLRRAGDVALIEQSADTVHLTFEGIDVSVFVLPELGPHTANNSLTVTGLLATKVHAILDRGTRRDFFDLYVLLQVEALGLLECLSALSKVYATDVNSGLVLRALTYFDDADAEAALPGEGTSDWRRVRDFFSMAVAALLVPPTRPLEIQSCVVDVQPLASGRARSKVTRRARSPGASSRKTASSATPAGRSRPK